MTRCVLCAHDAHGTIVNRIARNGTPQTMVACARCAFVQAVPMPSAETLSAYYASGQYRCEFPPLRTEEQEEAIAKEAAEFVRTQMTPTLPGSVYPVGHPLEFGCGAGRVAALLDADAIELDPSMAALASARGVNVNRPAYGDASKVGGPYPFVYAMQVLEHQPDPVATLREWRSYLAPGGRVHVQVPTLEAMYGGAAHWFQWPHVVNFTSRTLVVALRLAGFDRINFGISGTVLWATATRAEDAAPRYEDIVLEMPVDDPAALIAAHERSRRGVPCPICAAPQLGVAPCPHAIVEVAEVARLGSTLDLARASIAKMAADLHEEAIRLGEDYADDPFLFGYLQGKARQSATLETVLTALANGIATRVAKEGT